MGNRALEICKTKIGSGTLKDINNAEHHVTILYGNCVKDEKGRMSTNVLSKQEYMKAFKDFMTTQEGQTYQYVSPAKHNNDIELSKQLILKAKANDGNLPEVYDSDRFGLLTKEEIVMIACTTTGKKTEDIANEYNTTDGSVISARNMNFAEIDEIIDQMEESSTKNYLRRKNAWSYGVAKSRTGLSFDVLKWLAQRYNWEVYDSVDGTPMIKKGGVERWLYGINGKSLREWIRRNPLQAGTVSEPMLSAEERKSIEAKYIEETTPAKPDVQQVEPENKTSEAEKESVKESASALSSKQETKPSAVAPAASAAIKSAEPEVRKENISVSTEMTSENQQKRKEAYNTIYNMLEMCGFSNDAAFFRNMENLSAETMTALNSVIRQCETKKKIEAFAREGSAINKDITLFEADKVILRTLSELTEEQIQNSGYDSVYTLIDMIKMMPAEDRKRVSIGMGVYSW